MRELFKRSLRKSRENWSQYRCEVAILLQVRKWDEYAVKKDRGSGAMISWRIYGRSRVGTGLLFLQIRFVQERRLFFGEIGKSVFISRKVNVNSRVNYM